jgi:transcriptional regulator with XRE-family HTH domain
MRFYEIVIRIKDQLHFSQEQLSRELSIRFPTVSRWENGRNLLSQPVKNALIECCVTKKVSVDIISALQSPEIYKFIESEKSF